MATFKELVKKAIDDGKIAIKGIKSENNIIKKILINFVKTFNAAKFRLIAEKLTGISKAKPIKLTDVQFMTIIFIIYKIPTWEKQSECQIEKKDIYNKIKSKPEWVSILNELKIKQKITIS